MYTVYPFLFFSMDSPSPRYHIKNHGDVLSLCPLGDDSRGLCTRTGNLERSPCHHAASQGENLGSMFSWGNFGYTKVPFHLPVWPKGFLTTLERPIFVGGFGIGMGSQIPMMLARNTDAPKECMEGTGRVRGSLASKNARRTKKFKECRVVAGESTI